LYKFIYVFLRFQICIINSIFPLLLYKRPGFTDECNFNNPIAVLKSKSVALMG
jgi:hypothetical protein